MYHPKLRITREGQIATVIIDRPEVRNAFDLSMWRGLQHTMEALSADDDLRCVVLRGAGDKAFSAGAISPPSPWNAAPKSGRKNTPACCTTACNRSAFASTPWSR